VPAYQGKRTGAVVSKTYARGIYHADCPAAQIVASLIRLMLTHHVLQFFVRNAFFVGKSINLVLLKIRIVAPRLVCEIAQSWDEFNRASQFVFFN